MSLRAAFAFCLISILPPGAVLAEPGVFRPPAADNVSLVSLWARSDRALALGVTRDGFQARAPVRAYWLSLEQPQAPRLLAALTLPDYYDQIADDGAGLALWSQSGGAVAFIGPSADESQLIVEKRVLISGLVAPQQAGAERRETTAVWQVQRLTDRLWVRGDAGLFALDVRNEARVTAHLDEHGAILVANDRLYRAVRTEPNAEGETQTLLEIRDAGVPELPELGRVHLRDFCCLTQILVQDGVAIVLDIEMRRIARIDVRNPAAPRVNQEEDGVPYFDARDGLDGYYALSSPYSDTLRLWRWNFAQGPIGVAYKEFGPRVDHRNQFGVHDGRLYLLSEDGELRVLSAR